MSAPAFKPVCAGESLRTEVPSPSERESVGGFVYPLHGSARSHARTTGTPVNTAFAPGLYAKAAACQLYQSDMKLRAGATDNFCIYEGLAL